VLNEKLYIPTQGRGIRPNSFPLSGEKGTEKEFEKRKKDERKREISKINAKRVKTKEKSVDTG
jgi:hypothetical protein